MNLIIRLLHSSAYLEFLLLIKSSSESPARAVFLLLELLWAASYEDEELSSSFSDDKETTRLDLREDFIDDGNDDGIEDGKVFLTAIGRRSFVRVSNAIRRAALIQIGDEFQHNCFMHGL